MKEIKDFCVSSNANGFDEFLKVLKEYFKLHLSGRTQKYYGVEDGIFSMWSSIPNVIEVAPQEAIALLTGKQLTEGERKDELEKLLVVGAKIKVGKKYAEENSCVEGEIFELVEGHFEYDNGLYTEDQTAPSIWEEISKEFNSIYHLFGNNLENFMDCEVLHSSHSETVPVQEEVKGDKIIIGDNENLKCITDQIEQVFKSHLDDETRIELSAKTAYYYFKNGINQYRKWKEESKSETAHLQQQLKEAKELIDKLSE